MSGDAWRDHRAERDVHALFPTPTLLTLLSPFCPCSLFLLGPPYRPPPAASNAARYPPGLHQGGGDRETAGIGERTRGGAVDGWERRK